MIRCKDHNPQAIGYCDSSDRYICLICDKWLEKPCRCSVESGCPFAGHSEEPKPSEDGCSFHG